MVCPIPARRYQLHSAATNPDFVPELFSLEIRTLVDAECVVVTSCATLSVLEITRASLRASEPDT